MSSNDSPNSSKRSQRLLEYNATLIDRIDLTPKLAIFRVKPDASEAYPEGLTPDFEPGQYAVLGLNNEARPELGKTVRAYSIASPPETKDYLDFYVRFVDQPVSDGPLTHMLWRLSPGDRLNIAPKIRGRFTIDATVGNDDPRIKLLVGAGTGLAPFYSMACSRLAASDLSDRLVILHGASYPSDLGYAEEITELAADHPERLAYFPTISRPKESPDWAGDVGRVEAYFEPDRIGELEDRLELGRGGINPDNVVIYICGLVGTIYEVVDKCLHYGFVPENRLVRRALNLGDFPVSLIYEQYDTTPIVDIKDKAKLKAMLEGTPFEGRVAATDAQPA